MSFWPNSEHWSVKIPLDTPHPRLAALAEHGWVQLSDADFEVPAGEYESLEYMDWKSGGDTNFAPIASEIRTTVAAPVIPGTWLFTWPSGAISAWRGAIRVRVWP